MNYENSTLEIYMNDRWGNYSPGVERTLMVAEAIASNLTGFVTGRSLMPGLLGVSRPLGSFQDWQADGEALSGVDEVFGEDYLNCYNQVQPLMAGARRAAQRAAPGAGRGLRTHQGRQAHPACNPGLATNTFHWRPASSSPRVVRAREKAIAGQCARPAGNVGGSGNLANACQPASGGQ